MNGNEPQFEIYGYQRKELKKELSSLKSYAKNFWMCHQMDKDMALVYGSTETYPMSDDAAKVVYDNTIKEIERISTDLTKPYK